MESTYRRQQIYSASGANVLLGFWVLISPFVLAYNHLAIATWNDVIVGIVIAWCALMRTLGGSNQAGWSWFNVLLGIWLIISPWVLGYANNVTALWNNVILGIVIGILAWMSAAATTSTPRTDTGAPPPL